MSKQKALLLATAALSCGLPAGADVVDRAIQEAMESRHVAGLCMAVVRKGKVVRKAAYGYANLEWKIKASPDTVFEIGSVTKQFTAVALMMLVEEGKVRLEDPVSVYLPDAPPAWKDVTVHHLLYHTSGIPSYTGLTGFEVTEKLSQKAFIERLAKHPLDFPPGTEHRYNNSGFNLAGHIIANVSGKDYWTFLRERIFEPLWMRSTRSRDLFDLIPKRADGYTFQDGRYVNRDSDLTDVFAAGAIVSTVLDLAKWDAALYTEKLVNQATLERMWTPHVLPDGTPVAYGLGWGVGESGGRRFVSHGGSTSGFSAVMRRFPERELTVIVLTNAEEMDVAADIALAVLPLVDP